MDGLESVKSSAGLNIFRILKSRPDLYSSCPSFVLLNLLFNSAEAEQFLIQILDLLLYYSLTNFEAEWMNLFD